MIYFILFVSDARLLLLATKFAEYRCINEKYISINEKFYFVYFRIYKLEFF